VNEVFSDKPGVLQSQLRAPLRAHKRQKITLAIPLSVVRRVHRRLRIGGQAEIQRGYGLVKGNLHGLHERRVMFFGGLDGPVAEQELDGAQILAVAKQLHGKRVTKAMRVLARSSKLSIVRRAEPIAQESLDFPLQKKYGDSWESNRARRRSGRKHAWSEFL
jgi:hypothetical protein